MSFDPIAGPKWVLVPFAVAYILSIFIYLAFTAKIAFRVLRVVLSDSSRDQILWYNVRNAHARRAAWADSDVRRFLLSTAVVGVLTFFASLMF